MADHPVDLRGIEKSFGHQTVVNNLDLAVRPGELVTLLGPSGCGKSTTLNMIAGFLEPDKGVVSLSGKDVTHVPPFLRDIGLVFQDYALFPHKSVADNIGFGLQMRKRPADEIKRRVEEALDLVRLNGLGARMPQQLSGGQRQRVALARALVINPTVLLLDEPMSNLDLKLREEMRLEISRLQRRLTIATVLVTHDQSEALAVSDRIAVMNNGRIEQIGAPADIYGQPASRFVAEFVGSMNFLSGVATQSAERGEHGVVQLGSRALTLRSSQAIGKGENVVVAVRPERCRLASVDDNDPEMLKVPGQVVQQVYLGANIEVHVATDCGPCIVAVPNDGRPTQLSTGASVIVAASISDCFVFASK